MHLAERRLDDHLAPGIGHTPGLGPQLARHALLDGGVVRDPAAGRDRVWLAVMPSPGVDEELRAMLGRVAAGGSAVVLGAVPGIGQELVRAVPALVTVAPGMSFRDSPCRHTAEPYALNEPLTQVTRSR